MTRFIPNPDDSHYYPEFPEEQVAIERRQVSLGEGADRELPIGSTATQFASLLFLRHRRLGAEIHFTILLLASLVSVLVGLYLTHNRVRSEFDRIFGPALGLRASLYQVDRDIALVQFARKVEARLIRVSESVSDIYSTRVHADSVLSLERVPMFGDSEVMAAYDSLPKVDEHLGLRPDKKYGWEYVSYVGQYRIGIPPPDAKLDDGRPDELQVATDSLKSRLQAAASLFREVFLSFPQDSSLTPALPHKYRRTVIYSERLERSEGNVAFLYAALALRNGDVATKNANVRIEKYITKRVKRDRDLDPEGNRVLLSLSTSVPSEAGSARNRYGDTDYPDKLWNKRIYAYVGFPTTALPQNYRVYDRRWFLDTIRSHAVVWSAQYGDIGTQVPIVTASVAIHDGSHPRGVVACDLRASSLARVEIDGRPILLNLLVSWLAAVVLLAVVYGSGQWQYFRFLFYSLATLYLVYLVEAWQWLLAPEERLTSEVFLQINTFISLLNSSLFLVMALYGFDEVERRSTLFRAFLPNIEAFLKRHHSTAQFFLASASAVLVWLVVITSESAFDGRGAGVWVDAIYSFLCLGLFSYRFAMFGVSVLRFPSLAAYAFVPVGLFYSVVQLGYPIFRSAPVYSWLLFFGKTAFLTIIVSTVFSYTQNYNYIRRQLAKILAKLLSRPFAGQLIVICAKWGSLDAPVIFVNQSLWDRLGRSGTGEVRSIFGERFVEPRPRVSLGELFELGKLEDVDSMLTASAGGESVQLVEGIRATLRGKESLRVFFYAIVRWYDSHIAAVRKREDQYFIAIGSSASSDWLKEERG
jgi:hypothetical protein